MTGAPPPPPEAALLRILERGGFSDNLIDRILFAETAPHLTKPGEREFLGLLRRCLEKAGVQAYGLDDFPSFELSAYERRKLQAKFVAMNVLKVGTRRRGGEGEGGGVSVVCRACERAPRGWLGGAAGPAGPGAARRGRGGGRPARVTRAGRGAGAGWTPPSRCC